MVAQSRVGRGIIDVWSWSLDRSVSEVARLWDMLSAEETMRATRFVKERDAMRFSTGRAYLRLILSHYLDASPHELLLKTNAFGKPQIGASSKPPLQFNLSHSSDKAVLAVCDSFPVGIDIEEIKPITEDVARHFFSARECAALKALPPEHYLHAFYRCWTRKEAFVKAHGTGLMLPLDSFDVAIHADAPPRLERLEGDADAPGRWTLLNLETPDGFAGAIAALTLGHPVTVSYQRIDDIEIEDIRIARPDRQAILVAQTDPPR